MEGEFWGPGVISLNCPLQVEDGVTLTLRAGTEIRFLGNYVADIRGNLDCLGTVTSPVTFTHSSATVAESWGFLRLWGHHSNWTYTVVKYGTGVNDLGGSTFDHCTFDTNGYGLATASSSDMSSSTLNNNTINLLVYAECAPDIDSINLVPTSNTMWNAYIDQRLDASVTNSWWGASPPDDELIWDETDMGTYGLLNYYGYTASLIVW